MILAPAPEVVPLVADAHGVVRVGNTRVTLDTVIAAFADGATAEEIAQQYPSLYLADVYSVIGYYLRHTADVDRIYTNAACSRMPCANRTRPVLIHRGSGSGCWRAVPAMDRKSCSCWQQTKTSTATLCAGCYGASQRWILSASKMSSCRGQRTL